MSRQPKSRNLLGQVGRGQNKGWASSKDPTIRPAIEGNLFLVFFGSLSRPSRQVLSLIVSGIAPPYACNLSVIGGKPERIKIHSPGLDRPPGDLGIVFHSNSNDNDRRPAPFGTIEFEKITWLIRLNSISHDSALIVVIPVLNDCEDVLFIYCVCGKAGLLTFIEPYTVGSWSPFELWRTTTQSSVLVL